MPDIKQAIMLEAQLRHIIGKLQHQIKNAVMSAPNPDAQTTPHGYAIVSLRSIRSNHTILSADYYLPQAQAAAVFGRIQSCKTVTDLQKRLLEMIQTESVTIGRNTTPLHPATIQVLQDVLASA